MNEYFWAGFATPFVALLVLLTLGALVSSLVEWVERPKKYHRKYSNTSSHSVCVRCGLTCVSEKPRSSRKMVAEHYRSEDCNDSINRPCVIVESDNWKRCIRHNSWGDELNENCRRVDAETLGENPK